MISGLEAKTQLQKRMILGTGKQSQQAGFTLVELVVVMTVLGIMAAIAIPSVDGLLDERRAREPVTSLLTMAREVRFRAIAEQRPYQIVLDRGGFRASRYFNPYGGIEGFDSLQEQLQLRQQEQEFVEASRQRGGEDQGSQVKNVAATAGLSFTQGYKLPDSIDYSVRAWRDTDWRSMEGSTFFRWVFQPSGMCDPIKVKFSHEAAYFEVEFHPLTADIRDENSWVGAN